jgi:hypothetical protein
VNIAALVQDWVNGTPNYGFIMMQEPNIPITAYDSSEYPIVDFRPWLEISYTSPQGISNTVVIRRTDSDPSAVADSYIRDAVNYCASTELATGNFNGSEKYTVVRFNFTVTPPDSPGTGTPGYWMNHPEAWPVSSIRIGCADYPIFTAIPLMQAPVAGDKTFTLFAALVAAKLNVLIGNASGCIANTITQADSWMCSHPVGSGVTAGGSASPWRIGEPLYLMLDQYNNGLLCAPHRD